jgi:hypothetical protein
MCGARLVLEPGQADAATGASTWLGRCEKQHWWLQSLVFGWIPIDPGAMAMDEAATEPTVTTDHGPG